MVESIKELRRICQATRDTELFGTGYPHWLDPEFEEAKFRQELEENCNLLYSDGWSKIWQPK